MNYQEIEPISKAEAEHIFAHGNNEQISMVLIQLSYHYADWHWVQFKVLYYLENGDNDLKNTAILCLAHLARIHRQLDIEIVMPILRNLKQDEYLGARASDALDDIEMFLNP